MSLVLFKLGIVLVLVSVVTKLRGGQAGFDSRQGQGVLPSPRPDRHEYRERYPRG